MTIKAINPATGETFASYQEMTDDGLRDAISKAHNEFLDWRRTGFSSRAGLMRQAAKVLRENAGKYADLMAREMGKPIRDGVAEVQKCAAACDYYADNAEQFLATEPIKTEARKSHVIFQPLGVVLAVMPWNFPFWQVFRFAAPGLMAGNGAVMKHSSNVPGCALAIERVFQDAGFPKDLFRTLMISNAQVDAVLENPLVRAATLTGSGPAGRARSSPTRSTMLRIPAPKPGSTKPQFCPDAFQAIRPASTTATDQPLRAISRAVVRPARPAPTTQTSTSRSAVSGARSGAGIPVAVYQLGE